MNLEIEIVHYTIEDLKLEVQKEVFFEGQTVLPITKHRAISHINNPRASENDTVLLIAKAKNQICGYIGMMPDYLFYENSKTKIAWLSTWWVSPELKGQGLGYRLMKEAFKCYDDNILAISPSKHSLKVFQQSEKFNFITLNKTKDYILKLPGTKNANAKNILKNFIINFINFYQNIKIDKWLKKNKLKSSIKFEEVKNISDEMNEFILKSNKNCIFKREKNEFNWILNFPWILNKASMPDKRPFYFSAYLDFFNNKSVIIKDNEKIIGFLFLKIRDRFMSASYLVIQNQYFNSITTVLGIIIKKYNIYSLTISNVLISNEIEKQNFPYIKENKFEYPIIVSKKFSHIDFSNYEFQFGFGDAVFT